MLSFMGCDGGAELAEGAGTADATAFAAEKYGLDDADDFLTEEQ